MHIPGTACVHTSSMCMHAIRMENCKLPVLCCFTVMVNIEGLVFCSFISYGRHEHNTHQNELETLLYRHWPT